jgi:holliday junction DNA helicase RuvB
MENSEQPNDVRDVQPSSSRHIIGQRHVAEALTIAIAPSFQEGKRLDEL